MVELIEEIRSIILKGSRFPQFPPEANLEYNLRVGYKEYKKMEIAIMR